MGWASNGSISGRAKAEPPPDGKRRPLARRPSFPSDIASRLKGHRFVRARLEASEARLAELQAAHASAPADAEAAIELAAAQIGLGRFADAWRTLRAGEEAGAEPQVLYGEGGALLIEMGRFSDALRWIAEAIACLPKQTAALLRLHRRILAALAEDAQQGVSPQGKLLYLEALELLVRDQPGEAEAKFAKLTRLFPAFVAGWIGWRGALEAKGEPEGLQQLERSWRVFSPRTQWAIGPGLSRRLSPRGLVFDPREVAPVRPAGQTLKPVATAEALIASADAILTLDPGGESFELEPIIPLKSAPQPRTSFSFVTAPRQIAVLEGAALVGRGLVLDRNGEVPAEVKPPCDLTKAGMQDRHGRIVADPVLFRDGLCPVEVHDEPAFLLAGPTDSGFGDWVLNFPPRLALMRALKLDCPVVVRVGRPGPWLDLLERLGVPRSRLILHDPNTVSVFRRLYIPSWPLPLRQQPMRDLFGVYGDLALPPEAPRGERLYLSREAVGTRKLVNEPQIRAAFEARGFRSIQPERLSFQEAHELFSRASVIGGAYGSAFLNAPAYGARPKGVIALMPPAADGFLGEIALWLGASGSRFAYLSGDPDGAGEEAWTLPVGQVEAALDELLQTVDRR
jgi:tetratricopeptide (TPR) repeat protein